MRKHSLVLILATFILAQAGAQVPTGDWILQKVDDNIGSDNKISHSRMIIHGRRASRTVESRSWIQGDEKSFTEYLAPPREAGTKMLKLEDQLWTYSPSTDRTIRISGHMLRQSVMGSDLSYEDLMEDRKLRDIYAAQVSGEEEYDGRACWALDLKAKEEDVAYYSRKLWVDKERFVVLKEDRFAKSGKLLKRTEVKDVQRLEGRWVPKKIVFKDMLKTGEGTEFLLDEVQFNVDIPDYIFSKASLRK
ncbi:MAG: outer membrane lipoprotein-sorting protein [Candidatus Aminicenantales bacterium]